MTFSQLSSKKWSEMVPPPRLTDRQWSNVSVLGVVLLVMAAAQLIGFSEFRSWFVDINVGPETAWAVGLIAAEVWAGLSFLKLRLTSAFRLVGTGLALAVAGFWFVENLQLISGGAASTLTNSGFFGKYFAQAPGWWTAIEASVLVLWTLYAVNLVKNKD